MGRTSPGRINLKRITDHLRVASRKGDRAALTLALDQMKTLAWSPRYWEKYLGLLRNPLARLVDLLVIKQGERIAYQKGWKKLGGGILPPPEGRHPPDDALASPRKRSRGPGPRPTPSRPHAPRRGPSPSQPSLFD